MSIKVKTKDFSDALQQIAKVVPTRSTLPILSCALFNFNKNQVKIKATNLETSINVSIASESDSDREDEPIAIPIYRILEISSKINQEKITLEIEQKISLKIKTENGVFSIAGQDYKEFPSDPIMKESASLEIEADKILDIISFTKNSTSKDELKPSLQGVLLKIERERIVGVSTDGHRLSRIITTNNSNIDKDFEIIAPTKFLTILSSFIEKKDKIDLEISNEYMSLSHKNITLFSKIIKDNYPDYEKVIPLDNNKTLQVNKKQIEEAIKRVSIFSNRSTKQITLNIENSHVELTTEDAENNTRGKEKIIATYKGEENIKIGFNSHFILEAITNIKKEDVIFFLNNPLSAAIISEKEKETDKLILLMPIRLND